MDEGQGRGQQGAGGGEQQGAGVGGFGKGVGAGGAGEIAETQAQHDRPAAALGRAEPVAQVVGELADPGDAVLVQRPCGDFAYTPQSFDGQRVQEGQFAIGRHEQQPVGLGDRAGHLGQEFGARHTDRDRQPGSLTHPRAQPGGDVDRRTSDPAEAADIQKRLIDGDALDLWCGVAENLEHQLAGLRVGRHARGHHDRVRAQPQRGPGVHRGADAARLGLVAGRQHDATADDHRSPAQAGIVPLLDRSVERVQVRMQDRCLGPLLVGGRIPDQHEHMFAWVGDMFSKWR